MDNRKIQHDYKKVVKNWMNKNGYKIYIKDIKEVTAARRNYSHGLHHRILYTAFFENMEVYTIELETRCGGIYSETSANFELVSIKKIY